MIVKSDMMQVLLTACPSFGEAWQAFQTEWADNADPPLYLALADFARYLVALLEEQDTASLKSAFGAIERLETDGDSFVREAASIGILEALQNHNLHRTTEPCEFEPYLHAESRRWWDKLNGFWDGDSTALRESSGAT